MAQRAVVTPSNGKAHLKAFRLHVGKCNKHFREGTSSLKGLFKYLREKAGNPVEFAGPSTEAKILDAKSKCFNPQDKRLDKYTPALESLVGAWGTNHDYRERSSTGLVPTTTVVGRHPSRSGDLVLAQTVASTLFDVRIADVEFSSAVARAAHAKLLPDGKSLYQTAFPWLSSPGHGQHDAYLYAAKSHPNHDGGMTLSDIQPIAKFVKNCRFAVCESIAATFIAECKAKGFAGRLEWVGIHYDRLKGHSIVVAYRHGVIDQPQTWGPDFFIVDLWYYNMGMRGAYLYAGADRAGYIKSEVTPYLGTGVETVGDFP